MMDSSVSFSSSSSSTSSLPPSSSTPTSSKTKGGGFQSFDFPPLLVRNIFRLGLSIPTPIQRKSFRPILSGRDCIASSRTGSGKTIAFLLPLMSKIFTKILSVSGDSESSLSYTNGNPFGILCLILSPTRELAMQTHKVCQSIIKGTPIRSSCIVGGESLTSQFSSLSSASGLPHLIIATPGRLIHLLMEMKFSLNSAEFIVLDEADRLFDMGFAQQIGEILRKTSENRQICLFSATLPTDLIEFTKQKLRSPAIITVDSEGKMSSELEIQFFTLRREEKLPSLIFLLNNEKIISPLNKTIIFVSTRHHVEFLQSLLTLLGFHCTYIYGQMDQTARKINLLKFRQKDGECRILIVTDVAARGIDIPLIDNCINYDFPCQPKLFIHRVGRAARAGRSGKALSLVCPDELPHMVDLHVFIGKKLQNVMDKSHKGSGIRSGIIGEVKEKEKAKDGKPQISLPPMDCYFGKIPSDDLSDTHERIQKTLSSNLSLQRMKTVSDRAFRLYFKSRGNASKMGLKKVKEEIHMENISIHPLFYNENDKGEMDHHNTPEQQRDSSDVNMLDFSSLSSFRPSRTIFEVLDSTSNMMQKKRTTDAKIIQKHQLHKEIQKENRKRNKEEEDNAEVRNGEGEGEGEKGEQEGEEDQFEDEENGDGDVSMRMGAKSEKKEDKHSSFSPLPLDRFSAIRSSRRDPNFYISSVPPSGHSANEQSGGTSASSSLSLGLSSQQLELAAHALDLVGDDSADIMKNRSKEVWNSKKRSFTTQQIQGDKFKKQRNESGDLITLEETKGKKSLYQKWQKKNRVGVTNIAELNDNDEKPNGDGELRSKAEIKKFRMDKEQKKFKNAPKKGKGAKGKGKGKGR